MDRQEIYGAAFKANYKWVIESSPDKVAAQLTADMRQIAQLQERLEVFCDLHSNLDIEDCQDGCPLCFMGNHQDKILNELIDTRKRLDAWREDSVAYDCLSEVAYDYYHFKAQDQEGFRCGKCHQIKPNHRKNCIVGKAGALLEKLREMGEI